MPKVPWRSPSSSAGRVIAVSSGSAAPSIENIFGLPPAFGFSYSSSSSYMRVVSLPKSCARNCIASSSPLARFSSTPTHPSVRLGGGGGSSVSISTWVIAQRTLSLTTRGSSRRERGATVDREDKMVAQDMKKKPVLLLDVMGTIVRDPFHVDMPAFFGLTFKELMAGKHPTAWVEFENGLLTEEEFAVKLFNDKRRYDYEGLKQCMSSGYEYLEGMEPLLQRLKLAGFDMHVFSNYPSWYTMIEDKLNLSQYLPWTFVSCHTGLRKPAPEAFTDAVEWLGVHPSDCIFIDDQQRNVEAASKAGMKGVQFQNARVLEKELAAAGIVLEPSIST